MLEDLFHRDAGDFRWQMIDPVSDGRIGYANWLFSYTSKMAGYAGRRILVEGTSRFRLRDGLIAEYGETANGGVGMVQLGVAPERVMKVLDRWSRELLARPEARPHLEHRGE
jgi:hypothetical protein